MKDQTEDLLLKDGRFCLKRSIVENAGASGANSAFEKYYALKGLQRLKKRVAFYAPIVGVTPAGILIKDLNYRWATCSRKDVLSFHWKCMMAPAKIIDYIVVHELCHIHHRNHSAAFWNEVDKVMPDYAERKNWLKKNGARLDL